MSSKTIMIRKVVYESLRKEKRRGESFSRLMERLLSKGSPLESLFGAWQAPHPRRRSRRPSRHREASL